MARTRKSKAVASQRRGKMKSVCCLEPVRNPPVFCFPRTFNSMVYRDEFDPRRRPSERNCRGTHSGVVCEYMERKMRRTLIVTVAHGVFFFPLCFPPPCLF